DRVRRTEYLMTVGQHELVVRCGWASQHVRSGLLDLLEGVAHHERSAVGLANRVGVLFRPEGQSELQALADTPLLLAINTETAQSNRLGVAEREALLEAVGGVGEQVNRSQKGNQRIAVGSEGVIGDVVTTEVRTELQGMYALGPGEVVDELILRDVTSL